MKSSGAIFSRQNIFPPDPFIPRTHYNPSPTKKIPKEQRKTSLSPVRLAKSPSLSVPQMEPLTLEHQNLLELPSLPLPFIPPSTEPQPSFSESWPSTDQESSLPHMTVSQENEALTHVASSGKYQASNATQADSVLARYVERFRHGRPQSREERQRSTVEEWQPFWWLSSSIPTTSSPSAMQPEQQARVSARERGRFSTSPVEHIRSSPPLSSHGTALDFSVVGLSDSSHCEPPDQGILQLQERASKLLLRSEHSISSSSLPISSDGVGSSNLSSPIGVDEPIQRPVVSTLINPTTALNCGPLVMPPRTRPENDILFQWRLRRKMEQARHWHIPHSQGPAPHQPQSQRDPCASDFPRQRAVQHHTPVSQEPTVPQELPPVSTAPASFSVASPALSSHYLSSPVSAHMHLLCDVLPCPHQSALPKRRRSPKKSEVPTRDHTQCLQKDQSSSTESESEDILSKESSSPPHPSSETTDGSWPAGEKNARRLQKNRLQREEPERSKKQTVTSCSKRKSISYRHIGEGSRESSQKRSTQADRGVSRDEAAKERVTARQEEHRRGQRERGRGSRKEGHSGDQAPPPSPVHNALGQVVSEVLFPTSDSPRPPRTPGSLDSPRHTPPGPPQSPAPVHSMPQAPEVVAQLLQEAEESDGLEFEDDPLLQVLRQQREWVKKQIREVDTILNEIQDEHT
ncbi:hypothetical protein GJAV_G00005140 [Gymnothorax javanicus]|nr:hypothetical protein GJAV_G00005140 [Gymnothorax javanicus]